MTLLEKPQFLNVDGQAIAYRAQAGHGTPLLWCGGFKSDMLGGKAQAISDWAKAHEAPFTRFDYSGHGESGGDFKDGTLSRWLKEAKAVYDLHDGAQIVIGSSMGGWIALRLAQIVRVKALILIAPAPDFTQKLMWDGFSSAIQQEIMTQGFWQRPSPYDGAGYPITRALIEDGRTHLMMGKTITTHADVHILAGKQDEDVPLSHILSLIACFTHNNVSLSVVHDGDHRLSRESDIAKLLEIIARQRGMATQ